MTLKDFMDRVNALVRANAARFQIVVNHETAVDGDTAYIGVSLVGDKANAIDRMNEIANDLAVLCQRIGDTARTECVADYGILSLGAVTISDRETRPSTTKVVLRIFPSVAVAQTRKGIDLVSETIPLLDTRGLRHECA